MRLGFDPHYCDTQKKTWHDYSQHILHLARPAGLPTLSNAANGARILMDWLGEGGQPVAPALAQARANVCIECPQNKTAHFFTGLTAAIAKAIHEQSREKLNLDLRVEGEDKLHSCAVCDCHLPLKIWVPMKNLLPRTTPEQMEKFPSFCFMKTENRKVLESLPTDVPETATIEA